jgi:ankyrin repeat protein
VDAGADVNAKDNYGMTPLDLALNEGQDRKIPMLLLRMQSKKQKQQQQQGLEAASEETIAATKSNLLEKAISEGFLEVAEHLLREGPPPSPMAFLAGLEKRSADLVSLLLRHGADPNGVADGEVSAAHPLRGAVVR